MDKMRQEFEAWVITRNVCVRYGAKLRTCPDGSYYDYRINDRWLAWKASRAALRDEMKHVVFSEDKHGSGLILSERVFEAIGDDSK